MDAGKGKLTPEQRETLRRRWEGCDIEGFDWLAREAQAAFGVTISRQAIAKSAVKGGWTKGGPPSQPLANTPSPGDVMDGCATTGKVAQPAEVVAATSRAVEPARSSHPAPVPLAPGEKPPGYVGGRPGLFRREYAQMIIDWFNVEPTKEVEVKGFGGVTRMQVVPVKPPTLVRFAQAIGVSVETVGRWATDVDDEGRPVHPEFAEAYTRARNLLESLMVEGAALGVYDGRTTQFVLKNWYGWKDQPDKDVAVAPVAIERLDELYIQRMAAARDRQARILDERRRLREAEGGQA